jgi:hypothetical protein
MTQSWSAVARHRFYGQTCNAAQSIPSTNIYVVILSPRFLRTKNLNHSVLPLASSKAKFSFFRFATHHSALAA